MAEDFREFIRIRYGDLIRTAYLLTGAPDAAEDLVQGALLKAMSRWDRIDEPMAYLRRIMVNQRTTVWRRIRSREVLTEAMPDRASRTDDAQAVAERDELLAALATLPARMRAVLVLRYWEDLSEAETAQVLGCGVGTVKSQASRGLTRLRQVLRPSVSLPTVTSWRAGEQL